MSAMRVTIDQAEFNGGVLAVSGWAFGGAAVRAVEITVPGVGRGEAQIGLPRADVAADFPDQPEALASGFQFMASLPGAEVAVSRIQIVVRTDQGVAATVNTPVGQGAAPPPPPTIDDSLRFYCDRMALFEDGEIEIAGWAAHIGEIDRIEIRLDGAPLGLAQIGGQREDVAANLPQIPSAINSGFDFQTRLPMLEAGEHEIEFAISTRSGDRLVRSSVGATQVARGERTASRGREDIRLNIESPKIVYGKFAHPIRRILTVTGWAIAREGLVSVEAYLDGAPVGALARGARRLDIAAAFPDFPETLTSGFSLALPRKVFTKSSHLLRISARDKRGQVKEIEVGVDVAPADLEEQLEPLRGFMPQAEIDMKTALIASAPSRAGFAVTIAPGAGLDGLDRTLRSLAAQAYPAFRVGLLASSREDADAARALAERVGVSLAILAPGLSLGAAAGGLAAGLAGHAAFVLRLRAGDRLGVDALLEYALEIAMRPEEDFLYADDRRAGPGGRVSPFFKPEWSPDLLLSTNYIGRAWCASLALTASAGVGADCGDYECVLKLSERAAEIGRMPFVALEASHAEGPRAERQALRAAAARRGWRAGVLPTAAPGVWRLKRRVTTRVMVSIIVPTAASRGLVEACIASLRAKTLYRNIEIVVLDNIADPDSPWKERLRRTADCVVECDEPFNWSRFNNLAAEAALGEFLLFLNDDVEAISPRWLHAMLEAAERPEVGVVGARLLYPDGRVQHAGMFLAQNGGRHAFRFSEADDVGPHGLAAATRNVVSVTGACLLVRRDVFDAIGGFDETHAIVNNDLDFCLKVWRSGRRVVYTPHATLIHHEAASRAGMGEVYDEAAFAGAWRNTFALGDPFLNPRLSRDDDDYAAEPEPTRALVVGRPLLARETVRRILVQKLDHIGDFITGLPAVRRLKARFPDAEIFVLAPAASAALAQLEPDIAEVIEFNFFHARSQSGLLDLEASALDALEARLRSYRFDIAVDLRKHAETRDVLKRSGARLLAGYDSRGMFPWLDVALEWEEDPPYLHKRAAVSDDFLALVEAVSIACERGPTLAGPTRAEAMARLSSLPAFADLRPGLFARPLVGVHPGAGNVTKEWPPGHFAALIDLLVSAFDVDVALVGAQAEKPVADQVLEAVVAKDRVWSLVGLTGLADLPALVSTMRLFVGNNSGPQHIAAALGAPTVNVHTGVVSAREWGPVGPMAVALQREMSCSPCYLDKASLCPRGLACMTGLSPGDVFAACERMLAPQMRGGTAPN